MNFKQIAINGNYIYGLTNDGIIYVATLNGDSVSSEWAQLQVRPVAPISQEEVDKVVVDNQKAKDKWKIGS